MKQMVRLIVTSATYRQSSNARPELDGAGSGEYAAGAPVAAAAAGGAGSRRGAVRRRAARPADRRAEREAAAAQGRRRAVVRRIGEVGGEHGADRYRRGLYIHFQRTTPYPQLMNFDAPNSNLACTRRERTDTPLQALNLLNDPVFFEAAQGLAFRVLRERRGALPRSPELRLPT